MGTFLDDKKNIKKIIDQLKKDIIILNKDIDDTIDKIYNLEEEDIQEDEINKGMELGNKTTKSLEDKLYRDSKTLGIKRVLLDTFEIDYENMEEFINYEIHSEQSEEDIVEMDDLNYADIDNMLYDSDLSEEYNIYNFPNPKERTEEFAGSETNKIEEYELI